MKKILSLFLSLILVSSMILCSFSSAAFAADEEIKLGKAVLDMTGDKINIDNSNVQKFGGEGFKADKEGDVIKIGAIPSADTRLQINTVKDAQISKGKVTVSYGLYLAAKSDGTLYFKARRGIATNMVIEANLYGGNFNLSPYKWYTITAEIDLDSTSNNWTVTAKDGNTVCGSQTGTCDFTGSYIGLVFLWGSPRDTEKPEGSGYDGNPAYYAVKDLYIFHEYNTPKSEILSVGSDGTVDNKLSFKLSKKIDSLTADHIFVKKADETIEASSIDSAESDGTGWIYTATLEGTPDSWTQYYLEIGGDLYGDYKEVKSDGLYDIAPMRMIFTTQPDELDTKEPVFTRTGNTLNAEITMANTSAPKDVCFVLASYSADGRKKEIVKNQYEDFVSDAVGSDANISVQVADGDILRLFVVENMSSKKAVFTKSWTIDADGNLLTPSAPSSGENTVPGTIELSGLDYGTKKIKADLKHITSDAASGIFTVYSNSDASNPVYIDYITTANDGSYLKEIAFGNDFVPGEYSVEFIVDSGASVVNSFTYYSDTQTKEMTRYNDILPLSKAALTSGALMQVILGINDNEEKIYNKFGLNNFDVLRADTKNTAYDSEANTRSNYYDLVNDKAEVFKLMKKGITPAATYRDLVILFNSSSKSRYDTENAGTGTNPSINNNDYGSTNTVVTENKGPSSSPSGGAMPSVPYVPNRVFSDINGHWASRYAEELSKRGIINGYTDGTFRPENNITRAELAKLLCEAFGSGDGSTADFTDVSQGSWYYKYIANALKDGIVTGFEDGSFKPDSFVTKQDAILMMYRAMLIKKSLPAGYMVFKDDLNISSYAIDATRCLGELGIITGNESREFLPRNNITRAEVAAVVCRGLDYLQSH